MLRGVFDYEACLCVGDEGVGEDHFILGLVSLGANGGLDKLTWGIASKSSCTLNTV